MRNELSICLNSTNLIGIMAITCPFILFIYANHIQKLNLCGTFETRPLHGGTEPADINYSCLTIVCAFNQ